MYPRHPPLSLFSVLVILCTPLLILCTRSGTPLRAGHPVHPDLPTQPLLQAHSVPGHGCSPAAHAPGGQVRRPILAFRPVNFTLVACVPSVIVAASGWCLSRNQ